MSEPASDPSTSDAPGDSATVIKGRDPHRRRSCGLSRDGAARADPASALWPAVAFSLAERDETGADRPRRAGVL